VSPPFIIADVFNLAYDNVFYRVSRFVSQCLNLLLALFYDVSLLRIFYYVSLFVSLSLRLCAALIAFRFIIGVWYSHYWFYRVGLAPSLYD